MQFNSRDIEHAPLDRRWETSNTPWRPWGVESSPQGARQISGGMLLAGVTQRHTQCDTPHLTLRLFDEQKMRCLLDGLDVHKNRCSQFRQRCCENMRKYPNVLSRVWSTLVMRSLVNGVAHIAGDCSEKYDHTTCQSNGHVEFSVDSGPFCCCCPRAPGNTFLSFPRFCRAGSLGVPFE